MADEKGIAEQLKAELEQLKAENHRLQGNNNKLHLINTTLQDEIKEMQQISDTTIAIVIGEVISMQENLLIVQAKNERIAIDHTQLDLSAVVVGQRYVFPGTMETVYSQICNTHHARIMAAEAIEAIGPKVEIRNKVNRHLVRWIMTSL